MYNDMMKQNKSIIDAYKKMQEKKQEQENSNNDKVKVPLTDKK